MFDIPQAVGRNYILAENHS